MKLNIKQDGYYSIEEKIVLKDGKFEGNLKHDNVNQDNIIIFTKPNMQGDRVTDYSIYTNDEKPWETYIRVFSNYEVLYVNYQTKGDTVDADDINKLTKDLINKLDTKEFEQLKQEVELIDKVLSGKADESEIQRLEEMIKDIVEGDDHEYIIPRVTVSPIMNELYYQKKTLEKPRVSWREDDWGSWDVSDINHLKLDDDRYYATTYCNVLENEGSITLKFRKNDRGPHILRQKRNGKNIVDTGHIRDKEKEHTLYVKKGDQVSIMASFVGDVYVDYKGEDSDLRLSVYKNGKVEELANKRLVEERLEDFTLKDELYGKVGLLDDLETEEKENIVAAINQLEGSKAEKEHIHSANDIQETFSKNFISTVDKLKIKEIDKKADNDETQKQLDNKIEWINNMSGKRITLYGNMINTEWGSNLSLTDAIDQKADKNKVVTSINGQTGDVELDLGLSGPITWGNLKGGS